MKLFLDCEFNGFGSELISLALVDENNHSFYEVVECLHPIPWVAQHVIPRLNQNPISLKQFQSRLQIFLFQYENIHVIADWPEDFSLFTRSLVLSPGKCIRTPDLTMQLWMESAQNTSVLSENPHNALADAQALKASYENAHR